MENLMFLDTHVVVWLYAGKIELLSSKAIDEVRNSDLLVSPVVRLELSYLQEIGKINQEAEKILDTLEKEIGLTIANDDFNEIIKEAIYLKWTRDPFDRIISAQAKIRKIKLLTKDRSILSNYELAFWD